MLLTAINFQNNLSYGLTFLLATLFVIAILHTYANLSGLTIRAVRAEAAFPGQLAEFEVLIERSKKREHYGLHAKWFTSSDAMENLVENDSVRLKLHMPVDKRGWFHPGRLLIESTYPLGLLRCWTWIDLDLQSLVYPKPLTCEDLPGIAGDQPQGAAAPVAGDDDFYGIRDYQRGDSLRQIHWKGLAKGQGVQSKQYTAYSQHSIWLDWESFSGLGIEQRLSHLCYWALEFDAQAQDYGLRLPGVTIAPNCSASHREEVLCALALHGLSSERQ